MKRLLALTAVLAISFVTASAQEYFGQNKVRYENYDFHVLKTEHFDIYYYDRESPVIPDVGRMAERWYTRLSQIFNWKLTSRQPVILYANPADFRSTTVIPGLIGEGTGGVTEPLRRRVVLPLAGPLAQTDHVLGHELVHAFQYDMSPKRGGLPGGGLERLPLWFVEGMAEYLSIGPLDAQTAMWMRDAVRRGKVPRIKDLDNPKYFPYRYGQALWAFIGGRFGDEAVGKAMQLGARSGDAAGSISSVVKVSPDALSKQWKEALQSEDQPVLEATTPPDKAGRVLVARKEGSGELNVSPAMSPDGKYFTFLSERSLFSIEMYLADAKTGEIKRRLTKTATDPHFNSLEFTHSTGAWSSDSKLFAYAHTEKSKPRITIYDVGKDENIRTLRFPSLGEITGITFSPDGRQIAFSAMDGGVTDLFIADSQSGELRQLTKDAYADLQPAWSPNGTSIAFVTDRFTTDLEDLSTGRYELALIDAGSGRTTPLKTFDQGNEINPQWGDEQNLYFVSNRSGIPNIYRVSLPNGSITQITNIQTGVAGITATSPALTVARDAKQVVYSAFVHDGYEIVSLDTEQEVAGFPPTPATIAGRNPAVLPPRREANGQVATALESPRQGLVSGDQFRTTNYRPSLSLDYVAPPSLGVGVGTFGTLVGGGTALHFSDMLNTRELTVTLQTFSTDASSILRNLSAGAEYVNQKSRWSWGFLGAQIPYSSALFSESLVVSGNQTAVVDQQLTTWEIDRQIAGILQYPFSRAMRAEFNLGYENIDFAAETRTTVIDPITGGLIGQDRQDVPAPPSLNMALGNAALVYDTSIFGGVSPVMGQRWRVQAGGNAGSLTFSSILADYRRYVHLARPLSLAGRVLTYGRLGGDAGNGQLQPLYLGYDSLVRGYDPQSISARECGPSLQQSNTCPVFDQLLGSRIAAMNAELRLELLGALGIIPSRGFIPVELAPFVDGGRAWGNVTGFNTASQKWVSSYGASLRVNLLGFAIGQVSYIHPNDRPAKSWVWQFSLLPGF